MSQTAKKIVKSFKSESRSGGVLHEIRAIAKKKQEEIRVVPLPLDLLCNLVEWDPTPAVFVRLIQLSKEHFNYLVVDNYSKVKHIVFHLGHLPTSQKPFLFVHRLKLHFFESFDERLFKCFPNIVHLEVDWNINVFYFTDSVFKFPFAAKLQSLSLHKCCAVTGSGFEHLEGLKSLEVSYNHKLTDDTFTNLDNLTDLRLENCIRIDGSFLEFTPNLQRLKLSYKKDFFETGNLVHLAHVEHLDLEHSYYTLKDETLENLPTIQRLTLWNLPRVRKLSLPEWWNLLELHIANNRFITDAFYEPFKKLEVLTIWGCRKIKGTYLNSLKDLRVLKILDNHNKINDKAIDQLAKLETFAVFRTHKITGSCFAKFKTLHNLLIRQNNGITVDKLDLLKSLKSIVLINVKNIEDHDFRHIRFKLKHLDRSKCVYRKDEKKKKSLLGNIFVGMNSEDKKKEHNMIVDEFRSF